MIIDLLIPQGISRRLDIPHLVVTKQGKLLYANEAFARKIGYKSANSLLASQDKVFADERSRQLWVKSHDKVKLKHGYRLCFCQKQKALQRIQDAAGEKFTLWMRCHSWKHKVKPDFVLECLLEDVSTEVEAEGRYKSLFEKLPVPCHEIGPRGVLTFINDAELELLGYARAERGNLLGKPVWTRLAPQDRTDAKRTVQQKMAGVCKVGGEPIYRNYLHKDRASIPVRIEDRFNLESGGQRTRIVSTLTDLRLPADLVLVLQRKNIVNSPLISDLPIYAFSKSRRHEVLNANQRLLQEWEKSGKKVVLGNTTDFDLFHRDLAKTYVADDRRVMRAQTTLQKIERHLFAQAESLSVVQVVKLPRTNAQGRVIGIQGFFWRVEDSELVKRELASRFSERVDEAFDEAYNRLPSPAFRSTPEGQLFYANDALGILLGCCDGEELVSRWEAKDWAERIRDSGLRIQYQNKIDLQQKAEDFQYPILQASGADIWVAESASVVKPTGGLLTYVEGFIHDIDQIKRSEQRYWNLFDNTQDVIYTHTAKEPFRFTSINRSGMRLSGYEQEEFLRLQLNELIHPDSLDQVRTEFEQKRTNPDQVREPYQAKILTKHRKTRTVLIHSFVRKDNFGNVVEIVGVCQDLTERIRMQNDLEERLNTEMALKAYILEQGKLDSAANMINVVTHDLVTAHQTIRNESRIVADYIRGAKPIAVTIVKDALSNMLATISRANDLVKRLKNFKGKQVANMSDCRVSELLRESWSQLKPNVPETIEFREDFDPKVDVARLDKDWLKNGLINIFNNSVYELGSKKGWIHVKTTSAPNDLGNGWLVIQVSDNGGGVSDSVRAQMFDPCFTTKPDGEGYGLGLAEVKKCIEAHGGEIDACNGESGGLIITMKFLNPNYETARPSD